MYTKRIWADALLLTIVGGCAVGPNYRSPDTTTPGGWSGLHPTIPTSQPSGVTDQPAEVAAWWRTLNDPTLDDLLAEAAESNLDLRLATARLREARAQRDVVAAPLFPQVNVSGDYTYRGSSENTAPATTGNRKSLSRFLPSVSVRPGTAGAPPSVNFQPQSIVRGGGQNPGVVIQPEGLSVPGGVNAPSVTVSPPGSGGVGQLARGLNLFQAGFDATWELDVFGGVRRAVEGAEGDIAAAVETRRGVLVTLLSEVARNYAELRGAQRRLTIAYENIAAQLDTVELTQSRYDAGFTNELDVSQARAQLATTQSQVPLLAVSIRQAIYQLSVLLGKPPEALVEKLEPVEPLPTTPPDVPIGLPSDLLRRRPDIRVAERQLAAATARIGEAVADLFPKFSLTGSFGTQASDIRHFLDSKSFFWSVGPAVSWPIWDAGRIRANIEVQNARQEQALVTYEQTILIAFQDVESALVAYTYEKDRHQSLAEAVAANQRATDLSNELYSRGLTGFLNVLESQRALYATQDQLVQSETAAVDDLIALYKALGGGWEDSEY